MLSEAEVNQLEDADPFGYAGWEGEDEGILFSNLIASWREQRKEIKGLRAALGFMANEKNWETCDLDEGFVAMMRPGGSEQKGIMMFSRHLKPYVFAREVLNP